MPLAGQRHTRVLLVEDESLVALLAEDILVEAGYEVVLCMTLHDALSQAGQAEVEVAVLDINLGGAMSYPVADMLRARGIPFVFATGYGVAGLRDDLKSAPVIQKPYSPATLIGSVAGLRRAAA